MASQSSLILLCALSVACGDNQADGAARELLARVRSDDYRTWDRAPGWQERRPSGAPHSDAVDIYVNDRVAEVLALMEATDLWPEGSIIVKDGFSGSDLEIVAIMEKRADGWFWAEYDDDGDPDYSGQPRICIECHEGGSDFVQAFDLP
ncbi:MAG TPA: cytochrome P460 family protein [Polyangiaceae bacterium]|nr:cytochrome P460 family protein [Polyangiaceae bacterium]